MSSATATATGAARATGSGLERGWRRLRRMSTALALLFAVAAASAVATVVPQEPLVPTVVADWRAGEAGPGPTVSAALDALGLYDVYGAWWFAALIGCVFASLTGCLVPRWWSFVAGLRRRPGPAGSLEGLSHHETVVTRQPPGAALTAAERVLARQRFRRRRRHRLDAHHRPASAAGGDGTVGDAIGAGDHAAGREQLAAERGHAREGGSLVFHTSFYVLLVGVVVGQALGFTGQVDMVEGGAFADTRVAYDVAEPGRLFGLGDHRGFVVTLEDFSVDYLPNGIADDYAATVAISEDGEAVRTARLAINDPLTHRGMKLYLARYGVAPRVVVRRDGQRVFDQPVMLAQTDSGVWRGVAPVSSGGAAGDVGQAALEVTLLPDAADTTGRPVGSSPELVDPRLIGELYAGDDLGLAQALPASEFRRDPAALVDAPLVLAEGEVATTAGGAYTVEFADVAMWAGLQVRHAPGRGLVLAGGVLLFAGLVPSLYAYRRRVWVEAVADEDGARLVLAGRATQRPAAFADEFARLADDVRAAVEGPAGDQGGVVEAAADGPTRVTNPPSGA